MAKRRVYDIAKDRGMTNQEVLDVLRAGGLDIKSVSSTVEDADIARAFAPTINPGARRAAAPAGAAPGRGAAACLRHEEKPAATCRKEAAPAKPASACGTFGRREGRQQVAPVDGSRPAATPNAASLRPTASAPEPPGAARSPAQRSPQAGLPPDRPRTAGSRA